LVRASIKICKVVTSDSTAQLGGLTFNFDWAASTDAGNSVSVKAGTCSGNLGNFPIAGTGLTPALVTVTETGSTPPALFHVNGVTLTGGAPVSGFGNPTTTGNGLNGTIPYTVTFNPGPGTNVVTYYDQSNPAGA